MTQTYFKLICYNKKVIVNLLNLISDCQETPNQAIRQLLDSYLSFLEVLLMSDSSLEMALDTDIFEKLFAVIIGESYTLEEKKNALRCVSACLRKDKAILLVKILFFLMKGDQIKIIHECYDGFIQEALG